MKTPVPINEMTIQELDRNIYRARCELGLCGNTKERELELIDYLKRLNIELLKRAAPIPR